MAPRHSGTCDPLLTERALAARPRDTARAMSKEEDLRTLRGVYDEWLDDERL